MIFFANEEQVIFQKKKVIFNFIHLPMITDSKVILTGGEMRETRLMRMEYGFHFTFYQFPAPVHFAKSSFNLRVVFTFTCKHFSGWSDQQKNYLTIGEITNEGWLKNGIASKTWVYERYLRLLTTRWVVAFSNSVLVKFLSALIFLKSFHKINKIKLSETIKRYFFKKNNNKNKTKNMG